MTAPAVCEVSNCGVIAEGRCSACGRATCWQHVGGDDLGRYFRCLLCYSADQALAAKRVADEQARSAKGYFQEFRAQADLARHARPVAEVGLIYSRRSWYGGRAPFIQEALTGWYLGPLGWLESEPASLANSDRPRDVVAHYPTVLLDGNSLRRIQEINAEYVKLRVSSGFVTVKHVSRPKDVLVIDRERFAELVDFDTAAARVRDLLRSNH